jgi:hypothetical protein
MRHESAGQLGQISAVASVIGSPITASCAAIISGLLAKLPVLGRLFLEIAMALSDKPAKHCVSGADRCWINRIFGTDVMRLIENARFFIPRLIIP